MFLVVLLALTLLYTAAPGWVERTRNTVRLTDPPAAAPGARALHERLIIADLHADTLLWARDPLRRASRGHVDVPRLIDGGVALQVFSAVTRVPAGSGYLNNAADRDLIPWLAFAQRWPPASWTSSLERALYQAERLHRAAAASGGALTLIRSAADLDAYLLRRLREPDITAGLLAIEGLHLLDGQPGALEPLMEAGYRVIGLAHLFDNEVAGSAHGIVQGGLTAFGIEIIDRLEAQSITIDLAHASRLAIDQTLDRVTRPVIVSHTGVVGTCPGPRNLSDSQIDRIAANGGVIGIALFDAALCGIEPADFARAVRHVVDRVGVGHVALGSDFDGSVRTMFDVAGLPLITGALLEAGFGEDEIALIMGGNVIRLLRGNLPP